MGVVGHARLGWQAGGHREASWNATEHGAAELVHEVQVVRELVDDLAAGALGEHGARGEGLGVDGPCCGLATALAGELDLLSTRNFGDQSWDGTWHGM